MCFLPFVAQMLKKITTEEVLEDKSTAELDALKHRDWVRRNNKGTAWQGAQYISVFDWRSRCCYVDACRCVCWCCFHARHVFGCSWWRSSDREWSWRRCRSSRSTRCPPSLASRPLRCWCRTYERASSSYVKSWWEISPSFKKSSQLLDTIWIRKIWKQFKCQLSNN